jgi:hypothetical protein
MSNSKEIVGFADLLLIIWVRGSAPTVRGARERQGFPRRGSDDRHAESDNIEPSIDRLMKRFEREENVDFQWKKRRGDTVISVFSHL